ncbi:MAG: hypothetical protein QW719_00705, partial [Candidatus Micrarchaeaceae archaeon]
MLLALLFIVLSVLLGVSILSKIDFAKGVIVKFTFGFPVGMIISSFILFALYAVNGYFDNTIFYVTLVLIASITIVLFYPFRFDKFSVYDYTNQKKERTTFMHVTIWSLIVYAIIAFVLLSSLYMKNGTLYCLGPAICSDLMYHIGIGNSLIYTHFPPKYLFTIDATNVFPFISDFYTAVLIRFGLGLQWAVLLPDLILFFSAVLGTGFLAYRITKNLFITVASLFIFWFGSDYFMAIILYSLSRVSSLVPNFLQPLSIVLGDYGINTTGIGAILSSAQFIVSGWTSIIYQMLLPQRDFVMGLPIGVMLIYAIYLIAFEKVRFNKKELVFMGVMAGTLPLVHPVTLEVIGFVGIFAFAYMLSDKKLRKLAVYEFLIILIPLICLAVPQLAYMTHQKLAAGWYKFVYQSFIPATGNYFLSAVYGIANILIYWIEMVGIPLILAIIGLKLASKKVKFMFVPFLLLWIFITVYAVQPNPVDSNKIFVYVFMIISILAAYPLFWLYRKKALLAKIAAVVIIASISLNFAFVYRYWALSPLPWITSSAFNAVGFILNNTNQSAIFAVSNNDSLLQTVSSLAHRQTIISIEFYVSIDEYTYPLQLLDKINTQVFENGNCSVIREYNISYIFYQESNTSGEKVFENSNFVMLYNTTDNLRNRVIAIY